MEWWCGELLGSFAPRTCVIFPCSPREGLEECEVASILCGCGAERLDVGRL